MNVRSFLKSMFSRSHQKQLDEMRHLYMNERFLLIKTAFLMRIFIIYVKLIVPTIHFIFLHTP